MDDAEAIDPDRIELVVHLCTRIGMIMEDVIPLALDASRAGLEARVGEIVRAIRTMAAISDALEALMEQ